MEKLPPPQLVVALRGRAVRLHDSRKGLERWCFIDYHAWNVQELLRPGMLVSVRRVSRISFSPIIVVLVVQFKHSYAVRFGSLDIVPILKLKLDELAIEMPTAQHLVA